MDKENYRWERIKRLLKELRYELERGMMEREIDEHLMYRFYIPFSSNIQDGAVFCEFRTRPVTRHCINPDDFQPRLRLVKS